jgi:NAD(P)-dependent dehydrogenase (short-subunit alcohol dehydrogenase family)
MKNIIVTGASGNLGKATVKLFLKNNFHVAGCISPHDSGAEMDNSNLDVYPLDLTEPAACENLVHKVLQKQKTIYAVVLTVGGFIVGNIETVSKTDFEKMFALNFMTAFNMAQPVFKQMKIQPGGGKIILIGSDPGKDGSKAKGSVAYGLSKSLLFRLAELINAEGKEKNISAQVIVPTTMDTPQNRASMPDADFTKWTTPEIIAKEIFSVVV